VIVGLFIVTWVAALLVWRYGRIEERWGANLTTASQREASSELS
jgi:high-affinity nickel-transport protein